MTIEVRSGLSSGWTADIGSAVPGLPDLPAFMCQLDLAIRMAERQHSTFAVLLIDSGLSAADTGLLDMEHLDQVASAIRSTVRLTDTVAFLSGNEFAVLLSVGNEGGAVRVAGKIVAALEALGLADVAAGISIFGMHSREGGPLLRAAEGALYQARRARQAVVVAVKAEVAPAPSQEELEQRIGAAIKEDEFVLHFQPIVKLQSGLPVAVEALARWHHPQLGLLPPAEFLHLAEHDGTLIELSLRLVDSALALLRRWRDRGIPLSMSLNLALGVLEREGADQTILGCLHGLSLSPESLTLELRDEGLHALSPAVHKNLFGLASAGVCLSMDDFGRGASSLMALRDLPVQELKLDAAFVSQICRSEADAAIVGALIGLGRKLGKTVIAKGIESAEVRQRLCELGCEYGQGFHFAQALGPDELERWSARRLGGVA